MEPGIPDSESFAGVFTLFNNELHTKAPELSYKTRQQAALKSLLVQLQVFVLLLFLIAPGFSAAIISVIASWVSYLSLI